VKAILRKLAVLVMCAGVMLPVLSSADDVALLSTVLAGLGPSGVDRAVPVPPGPGALDSNFWALFDFLQCPALFRFAPQIGFSGEVFASDAGVRSMSAPRPAGRSPPFFV
jgi:hypothetical protein